MGKRQQLTSGRTKKVVEKNKATLVHIEDSALQHSDNVKIKCLSYPMAPKVWSTGQTASSTSLGELKYNFSGSSLTEVEKGGPKKSVF